MHDQRISATERHDLRGRARTIYEAIESNLEPSLKGKIVAVDVGSGEYFVGETILDAAKKARDKHPDKTFHFFRVGFPTVDVWR